MGRERPSIWLNQFDTGSEWLNKNADFDRFGLAVTAFDNKYLPCNSRISIEAYCSCCAQTRRMGINYDIARIDNGKLFVGWSEAFWCEICAMNSRMRATWDFLIEQNLTGKIDAYMPEAVTPFMPRWRGMFSSLESSEFFSEFTTPGSYHEVENYGFVRHEDLTNLSFSNENFDLIVCQEVFEHIPRYEVAFSECARVLRNQGKLVFTIPFFPDLFQTIIRASVGSDGSLIHHLPPEFHGNPMSNEGSLCFQYFGWDILDALRHSGFKSASAHQYWGPWQGHCGWPMFLFVATK